MVLIGLGTAGTNIVKKFSDNHKKITIDAGSEIPEFSSPEEFEQKLPSLKKLLKFKEDECYFVVCGAVNIIYVCPEEILLSPQQKKTNKVIYNVLQEYTRSGLLNSMWLFSNETISSIIPSVTMDNMWEKINEAIANSIENIVFYRSQKQKIIQDQDNKITSSFTVFKSDYDQSFYYAIHFTHFLQ